MPAGRVLNPESRDRALKTGYVERFDIKEPSKMPLLNAQNLTEHDLVVFDVFQSQINCGSNCYFIPVAVIPEGFEDDTWSEKLLDMWYNDWKAALEIHGDSLPVQKDKRTWEDILGEKKN